MAHHSKFLSVNLNKSYGKSSSTSSSSSTAGYGNGRPHSAGGGGGMVVLSRPRSSSGTTAHKPAPRLAVPPPMNLPSLRKEHERLNPASSKPSSGHGASGLGPGHNSSMSWTKPIPPMPDFRDKDGGARDLSAGQQRSFSSCSRPQGFTEKAVILRGEDFPSLLATSAFSSKQKQKQVSENSDGYAEKAELSSAIDMRPKLRSSPLTRSNVQGSEGGSSRVLSSSEQSRQADGNFPVPLPLVRLRYTSDWDDDERDRNHGISGIDHYDGRVLHGGEAPSSLSRDSGRGEPYGKDLMASKKEDRNCNSWRVMVESNKEFSASRVLLVDKDHFGPRNLSVGRGIGKESSHDRFSYGNRKEFGSGLGSGNARVTQAPNDRVEVSNNWQRGRTFTNGMVSKGSMSPRIKGFSTNDHVQNLTKEKLISNVVRSYAEDASWGGKDTLSSDAMLDFKAKLFRKKKDSMKHTDLFDPARESFEAELERVQRLQEQEKQQVMEEQAREIEVARREAEERERIAREEEERRRLLEEEVREAAWRAEQEKLEATRRAEEQRISRDEEKRKIIMEEERRKEAARQKLLELEARIARRQSEANNANDRIKESESLRDSDLAEWEKTERITDHITSSPLFDSSSMNKLFEAGLKPHTLSVENYKTENNWSNNNNSIIKFQEQDSSYPTARQDAFGSNRRFHRKQFQGIHGLKPPSFKRGVSDDQAQTGQSWDRNGDLDQFNGRSNIDAIFGGWDHGHFDGSQLVSYSDRSFQNNEVDDLASCSRVRHTIRQPRVPPPPSVSSSMRKSPFGDASVGPNSSFSVDSDARGNQMGRKEESDLQIVYGCSYHQRIIEPGVEPRTPELLEVPACSLLPTEEKSSPRYDSQSSLSVSNPPSSPTQLSHDEFDDCGGSPAPTTSAEEENITFSEGKPMIRDSDIGKTDTEMMPFSHAEDAGWAVEDNEEMQEVEDNEEGPDSNQEDNEAHESDTWELHMKNKFEDLDVVVEKPKVVGHAAYGIDDCVQLGASGHYSFNKDSEYGEKMSTNDELVSDSTAEHIFADSSAGSLQSKETIPDKIMIATSEISVETVKEHEDMIFGPVTTEDHPTDGIRVSKNSGQNPIAAVSRLSLPSTSSLCSISASVPMPSGQDDLPAKLQFGLFSSPPLIPSPLPTIQIGSIQTPLPLNAQINSYTQMHPSQPPLFQFGQIRHTPPSSQSVLSIATQTMSYKHHPPLAHHPLNINPGSSSKNQVSQDFTSMKVFDKGQPSFSAGKQSVCAPEITIPCQSNLDSEQPTALFDVERDDANFAASDEKKDVHNLISHSGNRATTSNNNFRSNVHSKRGRPHVDSLYSVRKPLTGQRTHETMSESRGRRFTYNIRNTDSLSSLIRTESSHVNSNRPQRRVRRNLQGIEYRVKESDGARQMQCTESFDFRGHSGRPNSGNSLEGVPLRNVGRKSPVISKSTKLTHEEAALSDFPVMGVISNMNRDNKKETLQTSIAASGNFHGDEGNLDKNGFLDGDIDTPLRSGIVRVFNQPGIEASSDGDGFVEVRSKRKMSNERRGQRERETNSKHKAGRLPHSHHATLSSNGISYKSDMITTLAGGAAAKSIHSDPVIAHRRPYSDLEISKLPTTSTAGQAMPPIGDPAVNSTCYDAKFNSVNLAGSDLSIANDRAKVVPSLSFGNNIVVLDKAPVPLGSWDTVHLHNQAVSSTQFRLDETMNPVQCNPVAVAIVSPDDSKHVTSIMTKEKPPFSSENLPNFPFDGEKIQFGAVESPPPLPPSSPSVPSGIWLPGSVILNASIIHNLPMNDHRESSFFDKEKCTSESCTQLDDTEAEAEAAASAVAVAAITNDEITVSTLGTGSISGIGTKGLSGLGVTNCTDATSQLASEESLVVTLPADLSVDTPRTLWPPLPSLQSSRSMLSHITGPQPSPFPFFDPNPMLGGPIFAFRPQDESTGAQPQQQQSAAFVSGPTGTWPQCHSGVDSFYGSPAGFPSPFMSPPAGLSGVHGQPPMVFYNHFAPVGQFGQVGLSYMGSPYLPTGKQPDWTHSSEGTSTINVSKADPCNLNVYGQQSTAHVPTPVQHLSTGSAVMQVTSPFTLFNLRPFKTSTEIPVPGQWPSIPHPSSNSIRLSTAPEQLQRLPSDVSGAKVSLHEPHSTAADLPDELGLVESAACISLNVQTTQASRNHATNSKKDPNGIHSSESSEVGLENMPTPKPQTFQQTTSPVQQHLGPIGKPELPRGSGRDWGRRNTFQGKHRNNSSNKNIGSSKAKQVYVAKSLLTTPATSSLS